jgi:hypothetical protein
MTAKINMPFSTNNQSLGESRGNNLVKLIQATGPDFQKPAIIAGPVMSNTTN